MKIRIFNFIIISCICFSCLNAYAAKKKYEKVPGGVDALIQVSKDQKEMQDVLAEETKAYKNVKRAVDSGAIMTGNQAKDIAAEYGEPVVKLQDKINQTEKWVYKPGYVDFFSQDQVWLIFDVSGSLNAVNYPALKPAPDQKN